MWGIELDRNGGVTLARQIYAAFRERIGAGEMGPGEALPSTRELAAQLRVSRGTVCEAYEMLLSEGYAISRPGAPTRVAPDLRLEKPLAARRAVPRKERPAVLVDFGTGQPDLTRFPRKAWGKLLCGAMEDLPPDLLGYTGPEGLPSLREEIAAWLLRSRGIAADPGDVFVTAGATQALHMLADLFSAEKKEILVEDPCHTGMRRAMQGRGVAIRPVPVDEQGMQTDLLPENKGACAVYVTPSHQFPLGGILPAIRRTALVRFARERGAYIVEDDYDSEFRYCGAPITPLYAMDPERVIYVGTFSKTMFPALRIGYVILPRVLQKRWRRLRVYTDVQNPLPEQAALAAFLKSRSLDRHVQKMRRLYAGRRLELLCALEREFAGGWCASGDASGLHIALAFPGRRFDAAFTGKGREMGLNVTAVERHGIVKGRHSDKLLVGYGHLGPEEIRRGAKLLRALFDAARRPNGPGY